MFVCKIRSFQGYLYFEDGDFWRVFTKRPEIIIVEQNKNIKTDQDVFCAI